MVNVCKFDSMYPKCGGPGLRGFVWSIFHIALRSGLLIQGSQNHLQYANLGSIIFIERLFVVDDVSFKK